MYEIGFGKHEMDVIKGMEILSLKSCSSMFSKIVDICSVPLTLDLIPNNFVSKLRNKKTEWRFGCSGPDCYKLEDNTKFQRCSGCVNYYPRRYCSQECQRQDWEEHKKVCQRQKEVKENEAGGS